MNFVVTSFSDLSGKPLPGLHHVNPQNPFGNYTGNNSSQAAKKVMTSLRQFMTTYFKRKDINQAVITLRDDSGNTWDYFIVNEKVEPKFLVTKRAKYIKFQNKAHAYLIREGETPRDAHRRWLNYKKKSDT